MTTAGTDHVRQPSRITGRRVQPASCSCGKAWEACERGRSAEARWQRLKYWLDGKISEGEPAPEFRLLAGQHDARLEIRARMDEMEASE